MIHTLEIKLSPAEAANPDHIRSSALRIVNTTDDENIHVAIRKRSIDARSRSPKVVLSIEVYVNEEIKKQPSVLSELKSPSTSKRVIIVGAGPAGYFAALHFLERGIMPIVLD